MIPVRRALAVSLVALIVSSCQGGGALTGATAPTASGPRFTNLQFGPSTSSASMLAGMGMPGSPTTPTAPSSPSFGAPTSGMSSLVGLMALASLGSQGAEVTEAKTRGYTGSMRDALEQVVQPILTDWAKDASLQMAMGMADSSGQNRVDAAVSPTSQGWLFVASSPSRNETLMFTVMGSETQIVKLTLPRTHIEMSGVTLSSGEVISRVTKAVADPAAKGEDPTPPKSGETSIFPGLGSSLTMYGGSGGEEVFAIAETSSWMLMLTQEWPEKTRSRLVWVAMEVSRAQPAGGYQTPAVARVDAATGQLLTLNRPRKVSFATPVPAMPG